MPTIRILNVDYNYLNKKSLEYLLSVQIESQWCHSGQCIDVPQVLVARKKSRRVTYGIAFVAMLVTIGIVITLVVVLTGDDSSAEQIISTTQGPTIPTPTLIPPSSTTTTTTTTTTTETPTTPSPGEINLDDIVNGEFSSPIFNGTWTSSKIVFSF